MPSAPFSCSSSGVVTLSATTGALAPMYWVDIWTWAEQAAADLRQELERVLSEDRS